jgi:hypothetical protein
VLWGTSWSLRSTRGKIGTNVMALRCSASGLMACWSGKSLGTGARNGEDAKISCHNVVGKLAVKRSELGSSVSVVVVGFPHLVNCRNCVNENKGGSGRKIDCLCREG